MSTSLFYPLTLFISFFELAGSAPLWSIFIFSAGLNIYLLKTNKKLKHSLKNQRTNNYSPSQEVVEVDHQKTLLDEGREPLKKKRTIKNQSALAAKSLSQCSLHELETELNNSVWLDDNEKENDVIDVTFGAPIFTSVTSISTEHDSLMQHMLQSLSGWHKSLVPFLLQNIGWFIGILCFISGSIFFITYTEGFTKSVTIFYTLLSYTLLLSWAGYHLKEKIIHASVSGNVLMAIGILLVPLNFSAAARLLSTSLVNSMASTQFIVAIVSTLISFITLYYFSKLISGVFNRKFLAHFLPIFITLSSIQLLVPMLQNSQSMVLLLIVQITIISLLLMSLISYLPILLRQIFVDRKYLLLFSVGSLIYAAMVSTVHITLSSPFTIALSYYAPLLMLTSGALFYMDGQLNEYKIRSNLLSYFSFIIYTLSFLAIYLSLDSQLSRVLTMLLGSLIYARLLWIYRSLTPLYLVIVLLSFLHYDLLITAIAPQWFYLLSLPLLVLFAVALFFLRAAEIQNTNRLSITHHLFHFIMLTSYLLSIYSQWYCATGNIALINSIAIIISNYYLLNSKRINVVQLLGRKLYAAYYYLQLFLPAILLLLSAEDIISIDHKLALITVLALFYSLNSHFKFLSISQLDCKDKLLNKEVWINASLLISLLLLILIGIGFTLSIKIGSLLFILSLNSLFLSLSLYNRALFYVFMLIVSVSVLIFKLILSSSSSTGFLVISVTFILFYLIHTLDKNKKDEIEALKFERIRQDNPEKILWFYPTNDFSLEILSQNVANNLEDIKNAQLP